MGIPSFLRVNYLQPNGLVKGKLNMEFSPFFGIFDDFLRRILGNNPFCPYFAHLLNKVHKFGNSGKWLHSKYESLFRRKKMILDEI